MDKEMVFTAKERISVIQDAIDFILINGHEVDEVRSCCIAADLTRVRMELESILAEEEKKNREN